MRYDFRVFSLVAVAGMLSMFLLSGCGANVCAFGHIGECKNTLPPINGQNNGTTTSGRMAMEPKDSNVQWGGSVVVLTKNVNINSKITADIGNATNFNGSQFVYVPGPGNGTKTARITIKAPDYNELYAETAPQNKNKLIRASIEVTE